MNSLHTYAYVYAYVCICANAHCSGFGSIGDHELFLVECGVGGNSEACVTRIEDDVDLDEI
jgi:hypothetical protein